MSWARDGPVSAQVIDGRIAYGMLAMDAYALGQATSCRVIGTLGTGNGLERLM